MLRTNIPFIFKRFFISCSSIYLILLSTPHLAYANDTQTFFAKQFDQVELTTPTLTHLVYQPQSPILTTITMQDTFDNPGVTELQVFAPVYPNLVRQTILTPPTLTLQPAALNGYPQIENELSPSHQQVFVAQVGISPSDTGFTATLTAKVLLKSIHLETVKPGIPVVVVPPLPAQAEALYLQATNLINYDSPEFKQWLDTNNLHPLANETRIKYASRIYLFLQNHFTYYYAPNMNRVATNIIASGQTDCGGFSILYTAILRYHGIPARVLAGRWASAGFDDSKNGHYHVKSDFFSKNIGWVPIDVTSGVLFHKSPDDLRFFGVEPGHFLVMEVDPELSLDTIYGPEYTPFLQDFEFWVETPGNFSSTIQETWSVQQAND